MTYRFFVLVLFILAASSTAFASGDLLIMPTRLVFEERTRSAEVGLVNIGKEKAVYRITVVNQRMNREGTFEPITTSSSPTGEQFASEMIRYFPRVVSLDPGASQTVRVQIRRPPSLKNGEYRSHLLFRAVPEVSNQPEQAERGDGLTVRLQPVYGISIPIIVRHGNTSASASISKPRIVRSSDGGYKLQMVLQRSGSRSLYGNLGVELISSGGETKTIGEFKGIAVYTPNEEREIRIPWDRPIEQLSKGTIRVQFTDAESDEMLAKSETTFR